ncbi:cobalt ECF transporter T component CbiQ [Clostridium sp. C2-6-12]|uniref:cobalt ECF transporter T component CbiQ n=1 Tax=Clostridium sp. C2-6-12 TaxID=2698832 RepID=UPI001369D1B1|nr:cobalt ECF transporter T component CbiQ [Clostridium sp. C2-6-12]
MGKIIILCAVFMIGIVFYKFKYKSKNNNSKALSNNYKIKHKHGEGYYIDFYAYASKIRPWNSTFKVSLSVLTVILCIVLDNPYVSIVIIISMSYLTVIKGGIPINEYLSVLAIPMFFILLSTFTIAIDFSKQPMGEYNLFLGFCYIFTTIDQLKKMAFLILKIFAAISALQMLTLSTPSSEIIYVLRKARIPKIIVELMSLIYRYIFILIDVYSKMKNSAKSRQGYCDFKTSCYTFGSIASNMFIISLGKANAYYDAMEARCYDGELLFLEEDKKVEIGQATTFTAYMSFLILLWLFTR